MIYTSDDWAKALTDFIDLKGGDGPSLWNWSEECPSPEKVVQHLDELFELHCQMAADEELEACVEWLGDAPVVWENNEEIHPGSYLRIARRPKPTLKELALKDLETVRKCSNVLPEILDTIEAALKTISDSK